MCAYIVIQIRDKVDKDIETSSKSLQENKLKIIQKLDSKKTSNNETQYIISTESTYPLKPEKMYIEKLLLYLRKHQSILYKILIKAEDSQKQNLAILVSDFMYDNIFRSDSIQEELLIMLYRTLKHEIQNLKNQNKPKEFLKNSINSFILESLVKNQDIKTYFGKLIVKLSDLLESYEDIKEVMFDLKALNNCIQNQRKKPSITSLNKSRISTIDLTDFFKDYIPDLNNKELQTHLQNATDNNMKEYLNKLINENKNEVYVNSHFLGKVFDNKDSDSIIDLYYKNFSLVIELINKLLNDLNQTITAVPNSIRYICKIISILIKQKFPNILQCELNAFINEFLSNYIILPLLSQPELSGLTLNKFTSESTRKNIKIIGEILKHLLSGELYTIKENASMTFFNTYFINKYPEVFHVFSNLIDIELPFVLENFIYNKNEIKYNRETVTDIDDFIYDYFSLYPEEQIFYHNICYHSKHIVTIIDIMKKNKDFIMTTPKAQSATSSEEYNIFLKSFEKLIDKSHYNNMKNSYEKDKANKTKTYNILTSKFYNTKLKAITALKTQHFAIPEIPSPQNETERNINTVIRVKNCFSEILYNIHNIPKKDFFGYKINSFDDFINALMEISKINYYILNDSVNTDWYILTLKTLIYKIPNEYKEDNYKKLFEELTQELQNSILKMDYDTMSSVVDSYRYLDKELKKSIQSVEDFETIDFNTTVQNFINNAKIEVYVKVSESETSKKKLDVVPNSPNVNLKEKFFDNFTHDKKSGQLNSCCLCSKINHFIKVFPNIIKQSEDIDEDNIFDFEKALEVPGVIEKYFSYIKESMPVNFDSKNIQSNGGEESKHKKEHKHKDKKNANKNALKKVTDQQTLELHNRILQEISNYIMNKLYIKLFPNEQDEEDIKIYQKCLSLGWIEPGYICSIGKVSIDDFLPQTEGYVHMLDNVKNPIGKMELFQKIINILLNTLVFIFGKCEGGVDDLLPLLTYVIIKSAPKYFAANLKYIELYYPNLENGNERQKLIMLIAVKEKILNFSYEDLNGNEISKEKYIETINDWNNKNRSNKLVSK